MFDRFNWNTLIRGRADDTWGGGGGLGFFSEEKFVNRLSTKIILPSRHLKKSANK